MTQRNVIIVVIVFLIIVVVMVYMFFRAQQKKAEQELKKAQIEAITGIEPPSSPVGGIIQGVLGIFTGGLLSKK